MMRFILIVPVCLVILLGSIAYAQDKSLTRLPDGKILAADDSWSADITTLYAIRASLGKSYDLGNDNNVVKILEDFNALGIKDHILLGVWGDDTDEGKIQNKVKSGVSYEQARTDYFVGKGYPGEKALLKLRLEEAYDSKRLTWDECLAYESLRDEKELRKILEEKVK